MNLNDNYSKNQTLIDTTMALLQHKVKVKLRDESRVFCNHAISHLMTHRPSRTSFQVVSLRSRNLHLLCVTRNSMRKYDWQECKALWYLDALSQMLIGHFGVSAWHYVHADKFLPTLREEKKSISDFHWSILLKFCIKRSGINHIEEIIRQEGSFSNKTEYKVT